MVQVIQNYSPWQALGSSAGQGLGQGFSNTMENLMAYKLRQDRINTAFDQLQNGTYTDPKTGQIMPLNEAPIQYQAQQGARALLSAGPEGAQALEPYLRNLYNSGRSSAYTEIPSTETPNIPKNGVAAGNARISTPQVNTFVEGNKKGARYKTNPGNPNFKKNISNTTTPIPANQVLQTAMARMQRNPNLSPEEAIAPERLYNEQQQIQLQNWNATKQNLDDRLAKEKFSVAPEGKPRDLTNSLLSAASGGILGTLGNLAYDKISPGTISGESLPEWVKDVYYDAARELFDQGVQDPEQIFPEAMRKTKEFYKKVRDAEDVMNRPNWLNNIYRKMTGNQVSEEQAMKSQRDAIQFLIDDGKYDIARSIVSGNGWGTVGTEKIVWDDIPKQEMEYIKKEIPKANKDNTDNSAALTLYLGNFLQNYPDENLVLLRDEMMKKNYTWQDFMKAIQTLEEKGQFVPNDDQTKLMENIRKGPTPNISTLFDNVVWGKR